MVKEFFDVDVFEEQYDGNDHKIRRYLLLYRCYLYLVYSSTFEENISGSPLKVNTSLWIRELCEYQEFRQIHHRHKHYYEDLWKRVDEALSKTDHRRHQKSLYRKYTSESYSETLRRVLRKKLAEKANFIGKGPNAETLDEPGVFFETWDRYPDDFEAISRIAEIADGP